MISFKIISNISEVDAVNLPDREECVYILSELLSMPEIEIAYCVFGGALIIRMCDNCEYVFDYPYCFGESDARTVLSEISVYARREMIPLVIANVPREELDVVADVFPRITAQVFDKDIDSFVVKVENEISALDEFPSIDIEGIALRKIEKCDSSSYAELCMDESVNKYWGYDYKEDNSNPETDYFYNVANGEFEAGVALTLGIYDGDKLVGECVMYDFDYFGGCEIGVRLFTNEQSKGYAGKAIRGLFELGTTLGLNKVVTRVMSVNTPAIRFVEKYMTLVGVTDDTHIYEHLLK